MKAIIAACVLVLGLGWGLLPGALALEEAQPVACVKPTRATDRAGHKALLELIRQLSDGRAVEYEKVRRMCYFVHPQYGQYLLTTFSLEGWGGGNGHSVYFGLARREDSGAFKMLGTGVIGGNVTFPEKVAVGAASGIRWHDATCMDIAFPARTVPAGANPVFPKADWPRSELVFRCKREDAPK